MAKLTALQIVNKVLENNGLPTVAVLTSLTGINNVALNMVDNVIMQIGTEDTFKQLEGDGTITLATATQSYNWTAASCTDLHRVDKDSFIYNESLHLPYLDVEELTHQTELYDEDATGAPKYVWEYNSLFYVWKIPTAGYNGKTIKFRYWSMPTRIDTATPTGTTWFAEPYDELVLVNIATARVMSYRQLPEAQIYAQLGSESLKAMKKVHRSPGFAKFAVKIIL